MMAIALCGYATRWNVPVEYNGRRIMMLPTACDRTLQSGAVVNLLVDHDDLVVVGSTTQNLDLHSDQHGLAFR